MRIKMLEEIPGMKIPPGIISTSTERAIALTLAGAGEPIDPGPAFLREVERRKKLEFKSVDRPVSEPVKSQAKKRKKKGK